MQGKYLGLNIVLLISLLVGCTNPPESPISAIPTILIDHIDETHETKVFVHGIDAHLFSNITIQINNVSITENFTYELHTSTSLNTFNLNVSVWDKQKEYEYIGNITVFKNNGEMKLEILDMDHKDPSEESLPYNIIMERKG